MTQNKTVVIAFGGNAITTEHQKGTFAEQLANIEHSCRDVVELAQAGYKIVITHGNGPQVGNILLKNELTKHLLPPMPLDVCVANTQGSLGFAIAQTLQNLLRHKAITREVAALVTRVEVDPRDAAFAKPSKPIGPFYTEAEARELMTNKNYVLQEDSGRGYRRVVPSPRPCAILESGVIKQLVAGGVIVVAAGGGGIPVVKGRDGYVGIEAVVDKDYAAVSLARSIGAEVLVILTGVPQVYVDYHLPTQRALGHIPVPLAQAYLATGQFPPGSMGPKIEAAVEFVTSTGGKAIITDFNNLQAALQGERGTLLLPG